MFPLKQLNTSTDICYNIYWAALWPLWSTFRQRSVNVSRGYLVIYHSFFFRPTGKITASLRASLPASVVCIISSRNYTGYEITIPCVDVAFLIARYGDVAYCKPSLFPSFPLLLLAKVSMYSLTKALGLPWKNVQKNGLRLAYERVFITLRKTARRYVASFSLSILDRQQLQ